MADATAETATDTTPATPTTDTPTEPEMDWKAEAEKWQALSRKNEDRAKDNAKKARELEELQRAQMSDTERAIAEARDAGRSQALVEVGSRLVDAEFRVATAGRGLDVDALLDGLDRTKFLTDTGEPNGDAVRSWVDRIAPAAPEAQAPLRAIDLGQGTASTPALGDDDAFAQLLLAKVGGPRTPQ